MAPKAIAPSATDAKPPKTRLKLPAASAPLKVPRGESDTSRSERTVPSSHHDKLPSPRGKLPSPRGKLPHALVRKGSKVTRSESSSNLTSRATASVEPHPGTSETMRAAEIERLKGKLKALEEAPSDTSSGANVRPSNATSVKASRGSSSATLDAVKARVCEEATHVRYDEDGSAVWAALFPEEEEQSAPSFRVAAELALVPSSLVEEIMTKAGSMDRMYPSLSRDEIAALVLYTSHTPSPASTIATALREDEAVRVAALTPWRDYIRLLLHAMAKLPDCQLTVFRGSSKTAEALGIDITPGAEFTWAGFLSASVCSESDFVRSFLTGASYTLWRLELTRPLARDIQPFALAAHKGCEVLLPPGCCFKIVTSERRGEGLLIDCCLSESSEPLMVEGLERPLPTTVAEVEAEAAKEKAEADERVSAQEQAVAEATKAAEEAVNRAAAELQKLKDAKAHAARAGERAAAAAVTAREEREATQPIELPEDELAKVGLSAALIEQYAAGEECAFWFIRADKLREQQTPSLPMMQAIRQTHATWLVQKTIRFSELCTEAYRRQYLVVSHRWEVTLRCTPAQAATWLLPPFTCTFDTLCRSWRRGKTAQMQRAARRRKSSGFCWRSRILSSCGMVRMPF